jgi:hypothetical protein
MAAIETYDYAVCARGLRSPLPLKKAGATYGVLAVTAAALGEVERATELRNAPVIVVLACLVGRTMIAAVELEERIDLR